ncbi:MAG: indole-3-glycerol phosphate synthase, partial [Deinococcus sp.]|nr:indole-3-glycerol phosphate synthase [Deinococcus sp.]
DERELEIAMQAGAEIIGVNNRDLTTLHIDLAVSPHLIARARAAGFTGLLVAESGYRTPADLGVVRGLADAVLVGSSLAGSGDLAQATRDLLSV